MNDSLSRALPLIEGILLGVLFFGGLSWSVRRGLASQRPALWFIVSLLARMSIALLGFYLVGREQWQRWLLCLIGFTLARFIVQYGSGAPQARHAP